MSVQAVSVRYHTVLLMLTLMLTIIVISVSITRAEAWRPAEAASPQPRRLVDSALAEELLDVSTGQGRRARAWASASRCQKAFSIIRSEVCPSSSIPCSGPTPAEGSCERKAWRAVFGVTPSVRQLAAPRPSASWLGAYPPCPLGMTQRQPGGCGAERRIAASPGESRMVRPSSLDSWRSPLLWGCSIRGAKRV